MSKFRISARLEDKSPVFVVEVFTNNREWVRLCEFDDAKKVRKFFAETSLAVDHIEGMM
jgi:hypothetical protein